MPVGVVVSIASLGDTNITLDRWKMVGISTTSLNGVLNNFKKSSKCPKHSLYFSSYTYLYLFILNYKGQKKEHTPRTCEEKLNLLEPANPKTIYDYELFPDRNISTFKEKVLPISLVQKNGGKVQVLMVTYYFNQLTTLHYIPHNKRKLRLNISQ